MKLSDQGRAFIIAYEKKRPTAYKDSAGKWTIGIGHLITEDEENYGLVDIEGYDAVKWRKAELNDDQMDALFAQDIAPREKALMTLLKREPTQQQFDAMFSLFFNIGETNFRTSSVLRLFNIGARVDTGAAFLLFNKVTDQKTKKKRVEPGLVKRRVQERAMFLDGIYNSTH